MKRFIFIGIAYFLAFVVAACVYLTSEESVLMRILYADIAATLVIFGFSFFFKNSSFYDAYWSIAPICIAATLMLSEPDGNLARELMVLFLVSFWGIRLTWNWAYGWQGLKHEDWRYVQLQDQTGGFYWIVSLLGIHLFPTAIVFLGCIGLFEVFKQPTPLGIYDFAAFAVTFLAILLETRADKELHLFRNTRTSTEEVLNTGLWSWCRHPNYLGELGFWFGLFIFGVAVTGGNPTDAMKAGPVSMLILFAVISIPMIDKKLQETKPSYSKYKAVSFALLPLSALKKRIVKANS